MKDKDRTFTFGQIVRIQPNVADQFAHIARYYIDTKADGEDITLLVGSMSKVITGRLIVLTIRGWPS